jgi:hypothetical protein
MTSSPADHPKLAVRSKTNAALVFGFHSDLRRVPTRSAPTTKPSRRSVPADYSADGQPLRSLGLVTQIAKWVAMLAAIAAPWVLLLSG